MTDRIIIHLEITTWQGQSAGAIHYYGKLVGEEDVKLQKKLTQKGAIAENKKFRELGYKGRVSRPGTLTDGFDTPDEIRAFAIKHWKEYYPDAVILIEGSSHTLEPQPILCGPTTRLKTRVNKLAKEAKKIDYWENDEKRMEEICDEWEELMKAYK